ncbi:hypothetical protein [Proteus terrae]|uniref:hypothetical protein n=1 Tax=Proteus terrae TaxID=1574161 RepID=UPI00288C5716|nr:hypothetical protein [Proteus terrae]
MDCATSPHGIPFAGLTTRRNHPFSAADQDRNAHGHAISNTSSRELDSASGNMTETDKKSVSTALTQVE